VIRQAISCDICATEKKQTNHWFVAYEQAGELRVSGWSTRNRLRPGTKHLCGQTCLHKLVDDFMARTVATRLQTAAAETGETCAAAAANDTSLTANAAYEEFESSARLLTPPEPVLPPPSCRAQAEVVALPARIPAEAALAAVSEPARYVSRSRRAEAWERERERELRSGEHRPDVGVRRRQSA